MNAISIRRTTKETDIALELDLQADPGEAIITTGVPFFDHMLRAMSFHGGFMLRVDATGDIEVDPHHLVEDVGLVLGDALHRWVEVNGAVARYGHAMIPMDDALAQAVIDVCERPYLAYDVQYPHERAGTFDLRLLKEFFTALSSRARINLHLACLSGENGHHMAEALFKALGRALHEAYASKSGAMSGMSTKGTL